MTLRLTACVLCALATTPVWSKPLIASSEETAARLCRAFDDSPERLAALCAQAVTDGAPTLAERAELLTLQGDALDLLGRHDEAAAAFTAAAAADPAHVRAHTGMAWLLWGLDREEEAVAHFRTAIEVRPTADGMAGLGSALYRSGQADAAAALELVRTALAIEPDYPWALREIGWIELDEGRFPEAIAAFDDAIDLNADDWNAHYGKSRALAKTGDHEAALVAAGRSVAADDGHQQVYAHRAYVLRQLDRNAQAVTEAARAVDLAPGWSAGHVQKALAEEAAVRRRWPPLPMRWSRGPTTPFCCTGTAMS